MGWHNGCSTFCVSKQLAYHSNLCDKHQQNVLNMWRICVKWVIDHKRHHKQDSLPHGFKWHALYGLTNFCFEIWLLCWCRIFLILTLGITPALLNWIKLAVEFQKEDACCAKLLAVHLENRFNCCEVRLVIQEVLQAAQVLCVKCVRWSAGGGERHLNLLHSRQR